MGAEGEAAVSPLHRRRRHGEDVYMSTEECRTSDVSHMDAELMFATCLGFELYETQWRNRLADVS